MGYCIVRTASLATLVYCATGVVSAQQATPPHFPLPDSQSILASVHEAQVRFERLRRRHLPWAQGLPSGECDEVIGRICYWNEENTWKPPPEPDRVTHERRQLIARLDSAAALLPADQWIVGQRVRYLVEGNRFLDALWVTNDCRAERWWCHALAGYVFHVMGDFAAADSSFDLSLESMLPGERCRWTDLFILVDQALVERYLDGDCRVREALNQQIWWLTDPLYLVTGNERRTEHYARLVVNRLFDGSANAYGVRWNEDDRELVLRYGWTIGWEREPPRPMVSASQQRTFGHHRKGGKHFLPPATYVDQPSNIHRDEWQLDPRNPRERYAPTYAATFRSLEHQLAAFRRGDSVVVVAAFEWREDGDQRDGGHDTEAALVVVPDHSTPATVVWDSIEGEAVRLAVRVPWKGALVSVEALDRRDSVAARARYWADLSQGFELLLVDANGALPRTLEDAISLARGSAAYAPGEPVHLYWEIADLPATTPRTLSLSVIKEGKSLLRQAIEWLGLAEGQKPRARLGWEESPEARSPVGRSITVRLSDDAEGRYLIRMEATTVDGKTVVAEREILVSSSPP